MENPTPSTKTVRVSYFDPDVTDSSSDEGSGKSQKKSKRKVHEIEVEFAENNHNPRPDSRDFHKETGLEKPNLKSEGEKMDGVRMTKSGKFWAEIEDPIKKRMVWLGVFGTAEKASRAYLAEESKFVVAAKSRAKQRVGWTASGNSPFQDSVPSVLNSDNTNLTSARKKIVGVWMTKSGKFSASIRDPFKKKEVWLGSFITAEEASRAHLAKKAQFEAKQLRVKKAQFDAKQLRAKRRIDRLADAKSTFQEGARKRISSIWRTKSGKFDAQITNPSTERLVYTGTFATEEETTRAYLAKEAGFAAEKLTAKWNLTSFQEVARTRISGVRRKKVGKFTAQITNPITKRSVWIGTFSNKAEAKRAYRAKEAEFEDELRAKHGLARVASEKSLAPDSVSSGLEIETLDLSNETGVAEYVEENKVSGEQEAEFGVFNGVHVVDKNGFLVGEFRMLDDFSICSEEEDANS